MSDEPALTGTLVTLRRWRPSDVDDVFRICQDREIQKWTMVPAPYSRADAVFFTGELSESGWNSGESASFAVVDCGSGRLAGAITVLAFHDGVADIGYWTAPEARGAGRTSEALRLVTAWCLGERGCARVELTTDVDNVGSRRVAESGRLRPRGHRAAALGRQRQAHRRRALLPSPDRSPAPATDQP